MRTAVAYVGAAGLLVATCWLCASYGLAGLALAGLGWLALKLYGAGVL